MKLVFQSMLLAVSTWGLGGFFLPEAAAKPPNVIVILADDLGYGDLGCYGARDIKSPVLDRLASEGMQFSRFYANSCVCSPTRAALLTGRYPDRVGVPGVIRTHADNSWGLLSQDAVLLPAALKKAGYHSAIVGKWHLGLESPNTPNERGFDFFHGFLGDMMDDYFTHLRHGNNYLRRNGEEIKPEGHATDLFTQWACDYLDTRRGKNEPFFLYLAYNAPHLPLDAAPQWLEQVTKREPNADAKRAKLIALIEHMDHGIGQVLETLRKNGMEQDTLVIFSSDNGGDLPAMASNGDLRAGKGTMYEGGLRVPFLAHWPNHVPAGAKSSQVALSMDIFATALELAGLERPGKIEAVSLLPVLTGRPAQAIQRDHYFVRREGGNEFGGKTIDAILRGDWKLLQTSPFAPIELFNLKDDPQEKIDLAKKEKKAFNELSSALRTHIQMGGAVPWQTGK